MMSRWWGEWVLGGTLLLVLISPVALMKAYREESAAVALVSKAGSGGSILIPASCGVQGAELNLDYVMADGEALQGRATGRTCFYTVSAFKRLFPERYRNDDPATFRVHQITTGTRVLVPSFSRVTRLVICAILAPFFILGLAMAKAAAELAVRAQADRSTDAR